MHERRRPKQDGGRTDPSGTLLDTPKEAEVGPSTTTDIMQLDKKLEIRLQREGVKPEEGRLLNRALY